MLVGAVGVLERLPEGGGGQRTRPGWDGSLRMFCAVLKQILQGGERAAGCLLAAVTGLWRFSCLQVRRLDDKRTRALSERGASS